MSAQNNREESIVNSVVLLLITLFCLGVSWYSMTKGYEQLAGGRPQSAAIATIFVLMLFACNYALRRGLISGITKTKVISILIVYALVVLLSFSGMFNTFYSEFMRNDLIRNELQEKAKSLDALKVAITGALTDVNSGKLKSDVEAKQTKLCDQIKNKAQPGMGREALAALAELEQALNTKFDRNFWNGRTDTATLEALCETYKAQVQSRLENALNNISENAGEKRQFVGDATKKLGDQVRELNSQNARMSSLPTDNDRADALKLIQTAVDEYRVSLTKANQLSGTPEVFKKFEDLRVKNGRIGQIPHTYESASENRKEWVVWVAAFLAFGIDCIVPLFVWVLTPRNVNPNIGTGRRDKDGPVVL